MSDVLRMVEVSKGYARGDRFVRVLCDLSLTIRSGEVVAVVGEKWEGKTTLLKVAAGLERPDSGEVWVGELELADAREEEREGLLGSDIAWLTRSEREEELIVLDALALPLVVGRRRGKREARELASAALDRVGVGACARQRWSELSNWERVLVSLAQGISCTPRLMLVDDLLDGHGMGRTTEVSRLLRDLVEELGCAVLLSVSDFDAALVGDRIFRFNDGRLELMAGVSDSAVDGIDAPTEVRRGG